MSDSWWARRLGGQQPSAPAAPGPAARWQPQYPPTAPPQPEPVQYGEGDDTYQRVRAQGYNVKAPANVKSSGECPECGGPNYFRRRWAHMECAPLCSDCGYNGDLFTQSGTLLNAVGASSSAPVAFARTDNPDGAGHFGTDPSVPTDFSWSGVR